MFNKILILGHVPKEWYCGLVKPIYEREVNLNQIITECLIESLMFDNELETTSFSHKKITLLTEHK